MKRKIAIFAMLVLIGYRLRDAMRWLVVERDAYKRKPRVTEPRRTSGGFVYVGTSDLWTKFLVYRFMDVVLVTFFLSFILS